MKLLVVIKKSDQEPAIYEYRNGIEFSDTVLSVKEKIEEKYEISVNRQYLQLRPGLGEPELDNELLVKDYYDIKDPGYWVLRALPPQGMPTIKTFDGKEIAINYDDDDAVNGDHSILSLMEKIEEKEGIPVAEQGLVHVYNGNKQWVDHTSSFSENKIGEASQLVCLQKAPLGTVMQITIKVTTRKEYTVDDLEVEPQETIKEFTLDVEPEETISSLKEKIKEKEGIDPIYQHLYYNNRWMYPYDDMMVRDCWIVSGCTLSVWPTRIMFSRTYFDEDVKRDEVIVDNTTSVNLSIVLSYEPFESRFAAKLFGGVTAGAKAGSGIIPGITANAAANTNFEVAYERFVKEAKPQKFNLGPHEESDKIFVEKGTEKLYYTLIVSNGDTSRVPRENILWPLPRRFLPLRKKKRRRGNILEINENDVNGGFEIELKLYGTEPSLGQRLLKLLCFCNP